jgi:RimJ/RimL family protein N-acetyltransferase
MLTRDIWGYLAGDPANGSFNRVLNTAIFSREIVGEDAFGLLLHTHPHGWQATLPVVCHPREPVRISRRRYLCREIRYDWRANIPEGFSVQWADQTLLDCPELDVPDDIRNVLKTRGSTGEPMQKGFGFVARYDGRIVAHAVVDSFAGGVGDIGLATVDGFRSCGLATVTAAATVDYGLSHGLAMISWDCDEDNLGSVRTAEKLGFERERDHVMYALIFD